jgi:putative flavoprotein involved in K+ transport
VCVIGGGPGGLAVAAMLRRQGVRTLVLERSAAVGASWRGHYDRLRLHTTRRMSSLPGLRIPRAFGRWVPRDKLVAYLESYAEFHRLDVVTGVEVTRVERAEDGRGGWLLRGTGGRAIPARAVVVATGHNHTPWLPDWPGLDSYGGELRHARDYRNAEPYSGKDVLVVGAGNTGAEIAVDLARGGAARVRLAVRTAPHIVRRSTLGWPSQASGVLSRLLPRWLVNTLAAALCRVSVPDLAAKGLPRPAEGLATRAAAGRIPVQDPGLVRAVRKGHVEPVAAVESFDDMEVVLADGTRIAVDAVIAATGYRRGLDGLVGHLDVLDKAGRPVANGRRTAAQAPDLYFTGYTTPLSGTLRELARDATRIARRVAR